MTPECALCGRPILAALQFAAWAAIVTSFVVLAFTTGVAATYAATLIWRKVRALLK